VKDNKSFSERPLFVRLKTARGRTVSSQKWLTRQLNDPYVHKAKSAGYRSRAAYKLIEIDHKFKILKKDGWVVDLGAAPGGWIQVALERVGPKGFVVGIDVIAMEPLQGAHLLCGDFCDPQKVQELKALLKHPIHVVLSDMAASSTGHPPTDHLRIMALAEEAFVFAKEVLAKGGAFVAKVLRGGAEKELLQLLKKHFDKVVHFKPPASRADSAEMYVIAIGFRS
jgi:23S rRNA (uridine2552-2'-O)-methyltransferase